MVLQDNIPLKSVMIDLSGTLHVEDEATPNAVEALKKLREANLRVRFVTNTTKESARVLHERLTRIGFEISREEIFSSLSAARDLLRKRGLKPMLLVDDKAMEDFEELTKFEGKPNAVVIGLAPDKFDKEYLDRAFRCLLDGADLIAIHEGRYYKRQDGLALGPGPFVRMLEYTAGLRATVVGKPTEEFFTSALDGVEPGSAIMIGDDAIDDVEGAQRLGVRGFLVRTGKYRNGDENKISTPPYKTVDNFSMAVESILEELRESK